MSWEPEAETPPATLQDSVSAVAIAIALAVPLLLVTRLLTQFA
ncbi:MAG TPA: hypothetical protein VKV73_28630 [Chloroflexota bacterium]|nr:hypothetical protein [Chloroflexota bacterium]